MHAKVGSRLAVLVALVAISASHRADAQVTDAATCPASPPACTTSRTSCCTMNPASSATSKTIIIPMDRCHQPQTGNSFPSTTGASPDWCYNPTNSSGTGFASSDDSMNYAYGLAYRLMQFQVPVYWIVNPTKGPSTVSNITLPGQSASNTSTEKDVDFWVLASGFYPPKSGASLSALGSATAPIKRLTSTLTVDTGWGSSGAYQEAQFPLRGGTFLILGADRTTGGAFGTGFEGMWNYRPSGRTGCGMSNTANCYDFTRVQLYEVDPTAHFAWQDFTKAKGNYPDAATCSGLCYYYYDNQVPVGMRVDYAPPKIAAAGSTNLSAWLKHANLNDFATNTSTCITGTAFSPSDAVACSMAESDIQANALSNGFTWLWINTHTNGGGLCNSMPYIKSFVTATTTASAGNVMFSDDAILMAEGCTSNNLMGNTTTGLATANSAVNETSSQPFIVRYPTNLFAQYGDLPLSFGNGTVTNWGARSSTGANLYNSVFNTAPVQLKRLMSQEHAATASNPLCNLHDDLGLVGATSSSTCDNSSTTATSGTPDADYTDIYTYDRYNNNANNGVVFYSPGNQINQNGVQSQLRMVLSALIATPPLRVEVAPTKVEISRAAPIATQINGNDVLVQGSYEYTYVSYPNGLGNIVQYPVPRTDSSVYTHDDVGLFTFPAKQGHMRARRVAGSATSGTTGYVNSTASTFDAGDTTSGAVLFDAASYVPNSACTSGGRFQSGCRTVFTSLGTGGTPGSNVYFDSGNTSLRNAVLDLSSCTSCTTTDQDTVISRIVKGSNPSGDHTTFYAKLGGVDRSTVAVIPTSNVISGVRPTMIYFGATDGMMHAVCGSVSGQCTQLGQELWGYVPRMNLPNLRYNSARIDGSPRVLDVYNRTTSTWKTVLIFQTGTGDATTSANTNPAAPGVYALDITDPTNPSVMWEYVTPSSRTAHEIGVGLTVAAGEATISGTKKNVVLAETNNGGTGSNGVVLTAINTDDGTALWTTPFTYDYPSTDASRGGTVSPAISMYGVPPGAVTIDTTLALGNGGWTQVLVPDLYGDIWLLNPNGTNTLTSLPLFKFSTNYHPITKPAIFERTSGGTPYAAFTDGGYYDTLDKTQWGDSTTTHYLIAAKINTSATTTLTENSGYPDVPIKVQFNSGEKGWAQATVVGNQVFATADTSDVNSVTYGTSASTSAHVYAANFTGASQVTQTSSATVFVSQAVTYGASSVGAFSTNTSVYTSVGSKQQELATGASSNTGFGATASIATALKRKLWLRVN